MISALPDQDYVYSAVKCLMINKIKMNHGVELGGD